MELVFFLSAILVAYLAFVFYGLYENNRKKKKFIFRLKEEYGNIPKTEYSQERINALVGYYRFHVKEDADVDDVTWNDIDGDSIFRRLNYCYSSSGEEYLYYRIRTLRFDVSEAERNALEERLALIDGDEDRRIRIQYAFAKLGRTGKYSIFQYIDWLDQVKEKSLWSFVLLLVGYVIGVVLLFVNVPICVFYFACLLIFLMLLYFKQKRDIEPYLISFAYLIRTLDFVNKLSKDSEASAIWKDDIERLMELRSRVKGISGIRMFFLTKSNGDDILELVKMYTNALTHFDLFCFYSMLKQVKEHKKEIDEILTILGKMESEISISSFRRSLPYYAVPVFADLPGMEVREGIHPLLKEPVANSFHIEKGMLLTGSNASGKSTFLKTVELCAILAQTIQTVPAQFYRAREYRIFSSMSLRDNLGGGESYYIVEIKAIKRILDAKDSEGKPILCFVDEVLRGTNTVERISAASEIMRAFTDSDVLSFAATHDVELTGILSDVYENYHFEEEVTNHDIRFPYRLQKGPAKSRNAIKLLNLMGYPKDLTSKAEERALKLLEEKVGANGE